MSRAWRIAYAGALYHVLSRGNERREIFVDDDDRRMFLDTLGEMAERFELDIAAYVLMGNHYHLLLRTRRANLSKSMQWFGVTYTNRFNSLNSHNGHLFQGRFKSLIVQNDAYLLRLSYYIHRNPVRAGIVERMAAYRWSSYARYAYGKKGPHWLNTELLLSQFVNVDDPHRAYRQAAQEYSKEEHLLWEDLHHGFILGSKQFVEAIKARYLPTAPHKEIPHQKKVACDIDPGVLLEKAAACLGTDLKRFKKSAKVSAQDVLDRDLLLYLVWQQGRQTNQQIGDLFGLTYSAVSRRISIFKNLIHWDKVAREKLERLKVE
ncbi:MAG TPA: transposase [Syntrophobacteria bacterium]|nr:transposase [Syntrophobacteria bacterium]